MNGNWPMNDRHSKGLQRRNEIGRYLLADIWVGMTMVLTAFGSSRSFR